MNCVLMIPGTDDKPYHGPARHVSEISRRLGRKGFLVINVVPSACKTFSYRKVDNSYFLVQVPVTDLSSIEVLLKRIDKAHLGLIPLYTSRVEALRNIIKCLDKPTIIHSHGFSVAAQPRKTSRLHRRLATFHGFGQLDLIVRERASFRSTLLNLMLARIYKRVDSYTTFSETMKSIGIRLYGLDPDKIAIVPHGVNAGFFSTRSSYEELQNVRTRFRLDREHVVFFMGFLVKGKGVEILLKAFKILKDRRRDVILAMKIGSLTDYAEMTSHIDRLDIKELVRVFTDRISDNELRALYQTSTTFVNYHFLSGHSTALLEAMASGVPPIVYKHSMNRDIVNKSCGIMLETLEPSELANTIEMLVDDEILVRKLGQRAKDRARSEYDWDSSVVPKYTSAYESLLEME